MRPVLLGLPLLLILVACASLPNEDESPAAAESVAAIEEGEGKAEPMACEPLSLFGQTFRLFTRADGTAVLRTEERPKEIGDPSSFATLEIRRQVVLPAADLAAAKREIANDYVWAGLLDPPGQPNLEPQVSLFRSEKAKLFVAALRCTAGAPPAEAQAELAEPLCSTPAKDDEAVLTISHDGDFTGQTMFPEARSTFAFAYQLAPWSIGAKGAKDATASMTRILRLGRLPAAPAGVESAREFIPASLDHLGAKFLDRFASYRDVDQKLVCTP